MSWTKNKYLQPQKPKIFLHGSPKKLLKKKKTWFYKAHEHCIFCMRSLRIPLYKAIRFSGIPLTVGILFLQLISSLLNFMHSFLYSSPFPIGSFTSSANWTFFFFLSFFFSSTIVTKKRQTISTIINEKKRTKKNKIEGTHVPESKQERRIFSSDCWEFWFLESRGSGKDLCLE